MPSRRFLGLLNVACYARLATRDEQRAASCRSSGLLGGTSTLFAAKLRLDSGAAVDSGSVGALRGGVAPGKMVATLDKKHLLALDSAGAHCEP